MSDIDASAVDRRSEPIIATSAARATASPPVLRSGGPSPFDVRKHAANRRSIDAVRPLVDRGLLLMILLIGVPLLLYCILFPTG